MTYQLLEGGLSEIRRKERVLVFPIEHKADGGYVASALCYGIHTQGETLEELRVKDAVNCFFDETMQPPAIIRLLAL
jgi:hypothetical protein